jgi:hypothetical protein
MPTSINYSPHAKGKWSPTILLALIVISVLSFINFRGPSKAEMIDRVLSRVRGGQFERLYEEGGDMLHSNVPKEKFVRRMEVAVARMKAIDGRLNFQRDADAEQVLLGGTVDSQAISAAERLERGSNFATVLLHWDSKGKFLDLSVMPYGNTPQEYAVLGVGAHHYNIGDRILDW